MDACKIADCHLPPTYKCLCTESEDRYCDRHAEEHLIVGDNHTLVANFLGLLPEKISLFSIQCRSCISKFKLTNNKMLQVLNENIQKITKIAINFIDENRKMEELYLNTLEYLATHDKVIKKQHPSAVEEFIFKYIENPNEILGDFIKTEAGLLKEVDLSRKLEESFEQGVKLSEELHQKIKEIDELRGEFEKTTAENAKLTQKFNYLKTKVDADAFEDLFTEYESKYMCFFENGNKNLNVIDVISGNDSKTAMNIPDNLGQVTGFCELPNNKCFYYSNIGGGHSEICYIFDIETKTGVKQRGHKAKLNIGTCCYLNNCVYSFGGYTPNANPCTDSEKFDLSTGEWQSIAPVTACHFVSTVSTKNTILMCAVNLGGIIEYNPNSNSYATYLNGNFAGGYYTVLCKGLGAIYIFSQNVFWDITNYKSTLKQINSSTGITNTYLLSYPIRHGVCIYFMISNKQIWRFNLFTKEVNLLRNSKV